MGMKILANALNDTKSITLLLKKKIENEVAR